MDLNQKVWAPDSESGFIIGVITDIGADSVSVTPFSHAGRKPISAPYDRVFPAEEDDDKNGGKTVEDNCALMFLNEATLLNNLRKRYANDRIYTYVANILVALNPYKPLRHLYDAKVLLANHVLVLIRMKDPLNSSAQLSSDLRCIGRRES